MRDAVRLLSCPLCYASLSKGYPVVLSKVTSSNMSGSSSSIGPSNRDSNHLKNILNGILRTNALQDGLYGSEIAPPLHTPLVLRRN